LLELVAVISILGIISAIGILRFVPNQVGNIAVQADARTLALDMRQARRRAIATGDNHYLSLVGGSPYTGYTLYRKADGGDVAVDEAHTFGDGVTVTSTGSQIEFNFEGQALSGYQVTLTAPDQTWQVTATISTGAARVQRTAP
jgi:type II secretory pathway pseudopilin PulG